MLRLFRYLSIFLLIILVVLSSAINNFYTPDDFTALELKIGLVCYIVVAPLMAFSIMSFGVLKFRSAILIRIKSHFMKNFFENKNEKFFVILTFMLTVCWIILVWQDIGNAILIFLKSENPHQYLK